MTDDVAETPAAASRTRLLVPISLVQVCVAAPGDCPSSGGDVDGHEVPGLDDGLTATVIPYGEAAAAENALKLWRDRELTADWEDLDRLDGPKAPSRP